MMDRLRRSSIYVPGDSERMLRKAAEIPADMLILNLEDGVSRAKKDEARGNLARSLRSAPFGDRELVVRINPIASEAGRRDLAELVPLRPHGVCIPKVESAREVLAVDHAVRELELAHGLSQGGTLFHAMIESAAGVLAAPEIARACPRMSSLIFGSADFVKDLRCRPEPDRQELALALQQIVLAARAARISAIDAPCFDLRNPDLLRRESQQARRLGFDGKNCLHPAQIAVVNEVFSVTPEELAWARRVIEELGVAEERGRSLSTLDGQLVDDPHRAAAEEILRRAALSRK
jgi:citrate lyase subunit beta/citryl-CoA lyase